MIQCKFENGHEASLRHVVVDTLILKDNKVLLVKRAPHLLCGGMYALVGGYVDRDETIEDAVVREAKEETGYDVVVDSLLRIKDSPNRPKEDRQNIGFAYIAHAVEQTGKPDNESTEMGWFDLDKLPSEDEFAFDHYEDIKEYKKKYAA